MKKIATLLIATLALLSSPSFAETASAPASAPDPAAAAAVHKMLDAMNYRDVVTKMMAQMSQSMPAMVKAGATDAIKNNPKLSSAQRLAAQVEMEAAMPDLLKKIDRVLNDPTLTDDMLAAMVPLYARTYTVAEIEQIAAFYASPVGKRVLETMPKLMNESMMIGQQIVGPRMNAVMNEALTSAVK